MRQFSFLITVIILLSLPLFSKGDWVVKIVTEDNDEHFIDAEEFNAEFMMIAKNTGLDKEDIKEFYQSEEDIREYLQTLIDEEILYIKASQMKLEKEINNMDDTIKDNVAKFYVMNSLKFEDVDESKIKITEDELIDFFTQYKLMAAQKNPNITLKYSEVKDNLAEELKKQKILMARQSAVSNQMDSILEGLKEKYELKIDVRVTNKNYSANPAAVITYKGGKVEITQDMLETHLPEMKKQWLLLQLQSGGRKGAKPDKLEVENQLKLLILQELMNNKIFRIKADLEGYFKTDEAKVFEGLLRKQMLQQEYIKRLAADIKPTDEEAKKASEALQERFNLSDRVAQKEFDRLEQMTLINLFVQNERSMKEIQAKLRDLKEQYRIIKDLDKIKSPY